MKFKIRVGHSAGPILHILEAPNFRRAAELAFKVPEASATIQRVSGWDGQAGAYFDETSKRILYVERAP